MSLTVEALYAAVVLKPLTPYEECFIRQLLRQAEQEYREIGAPGQAARLAVQ